eukprot:SAG22_NODE_263_length_13359_cov_3.396531_8_plen_72_part_00
MDEACAHVRVELDSKPAALDGAKRKILQLEIEATALEAEQTWNIFAKVRATAAAAVGHPSTTTNPPPTAGC